MGRKRFTKWNNERVINDTDYVHINNQVSGLQFFEIGDQITRDVSEAVALMMRIPNIDGQIWNYKFVLNINEINPTKCLYWLSGGDTEWQTLHNYRTNWNECCDMYLEKFGNRIIDILLNSKTLGDIRDNFLKYLNLPILYDFALERDLIR